jgi:putative ABC transport system ATP-binding protein
MIATISCLGVTRRYSSAGIEPVTAVASVDLSVAPGEFVAIAGPSGSGKTTLLGLLAGLESADEGTVTVLGHDLGRLSVKERARLRRTRIGIVFQSFGLLASLSAAENVALPLLLAGTASAERMARAHRALDEVGLEDRHDARIDECSGGERQRIGAARALVIEPALILADEPTGSLDNENAAIVLDLLSAAARSRGCSLVLVTHDGPSAARADRRYRMRDGQLEEVPR